MAMVRRDRQLSVFGVEARAPSPVDLEGLLAGSGELSRMGGTARVSIVVADAWRAEALRAACAARGLVSTVEVLLPDVPDEDLGAVELTSVPVDQDVDPVIALDDDLPDDDLPDADLPGGGRQDGGRQDGGRQGGGRQGGGTGPPKINEPPVEPVPVEDADPADGAAPVPPADATVDEDIVPEEDIAPVYRLRTAYSALLAPLAARWSGDGIRHLQLDGLRLRLWVIAAGAMDGAQAFILGADRAREDDDVGAALAAAGLPCVVVGQRGGGRGYRIVGRRRIARLAELIGEPPRQVPQGVWPGETV